MQPGPHGNQYQSPQLLIAPPQAEESTFDFWGVLSRRKWLVFLGLVFGLVAGGFYNSRCETVYKSTARVRIEPKDPPVFKFAERDIHDNFADFDIRHDQLIGEYNIVHACLFDTGLADTLGSINDLGEQEQVELVQDNLAITQNPEEPIIYEIELFSSDPYDAKSILSTLIETYRKELSEQYDESSKDTKELIEEMVSIFSKEFEEKQAELSVARGKSRMLIVSQGNLDTHQLQLPEIQLTIDKLQARLAEQSSDLKRVLNAIDGGAEEADKMVWMLKNEGKIKDDPYRVETNDQQIKRLEDQIFEYEIELQRVDQKLGPGHNSYKSLVSTIDKLKRRKADLESEGDVTEGRPPREVLEFFAEQQEQQIADLRTAIRKNTEEYDKHATKVAENEAVRLRVRELEEEVDEIRKNAEIAKKQLIEVESANAEGTRQKGFYFNTTMDATLGEEVWPILPVILGIGGLLGSLLGFGMGCLVELADRTFHNPDDIIKQLRVPLIGHIPVIGQSKRYLVENSLIEPIVCTYHRPKSQVSEAFRAVRTALYFNTQGKAHSVIQVTSPTPGDGKSTLASNLAVAIAQSGKRVLLVDADMRRPRQHGTFGISSNVGFATVLSGQSEWRDTMFECEEIEGLSIMPCGARPQNPAELCSSPQVKLLIEEMREEFDFVIIDTPPLLAVTDPCPIAARVDGVVVCLRIKKNVRVSAERALELLGNLGAVCIGLVVNGVGAQSGYGSQYTYGAYRAGYSYNGYGYGYGYGSGKYYEEDEKGRVANLPGAGPAKLEQQSTEY